MRYEEGDIITYTRIGCEVVSSTDALGDAVPVLRLKNKYGKFLIVKLDDTVSVSLTKRAKPKFWPPQLGDVWADKNGIDFHLISESSFAAPTLYSPRLKCNQFLGKECSAKDWTLVYRKGLKL